MDEFLDKLRKHAERKKDLYDGWNSVEGNLTLVYCFLNIFEEVGEIAGAIIRDRQELAKAECIDLAHAAMLIYKQLGDTQNSKSKR